MKKAVNINLAGIIFHIDEDAYEHLSAYLSALEYHFKSTGEGKEIMTDIEMRIAELLKERLGKNRQSVNLADVEYIISTMGKPSDLTGNYQTEYNYQQQKWYQKKVYRDIDNSVIGGVCAGLSHFFKIDVVWLRVLFVFLLFFGGSSFFIYFILWILLPAARTPIQKMEMRGEPINLPNIEQQIRSDTYNPERPMNKVRQFFEAAGIFLTQLLKAAFKVITVFIGLILLIIGVLMVLFFTLLWINPPGNYNLADFSFSLPSIFAFGAISNSWLHFIAFFLVFILPLLAIIYLGVKLVLRLTINDRVFWLTAFMLWLVGLLLWIIVFFTSFKELKTESYVSNDIQINNQPYKSITIDLIGTEKFEKPGKKFFETNKGTTYWINEQHQILGRPNFTIEYTNQPFATVSIEKFARGRNTEEATNYAQKVVYAFNQTDSIIRFDPYFEIQNRRDWHFQRVEIAIKLPKNTSICISEKLMDYISDANVEGNLWMSELPGHCWTMTEKGLRRADTILFD